MLSIAGGILLAYLVICLLEEILVLLGVGLIVGAALFLLSWMVYR